MLRTAGGLVPLEKEVEISVWKFLYALEEI